MLIFSSRKFICGTNSTFEEVRQYNYSQFRSSHFCIEQLISSMSLKIIFHILVWTNTFISRTYRNIYNNTIYVHIEAIDILVLS